MTAVIREPSLRDVSQQLARLFHRARKRWILTTTATMVVVGGAVGVIARVPVVHDLRAVVRVTEANDSPLVRNSWTHRDLRARATEVAFSNENLLALMQRFGMLRPKRGRVPDPQRALESFREDIHVDVVANQVVSLFDPRDRPRSARLIIRYKSSDRDEAIAVTRALAELVVKTGGAERVRDLEAALRSVDRSLEAARAQLAALDAEGASVGKGQLAAGAAEVVRARLDKDIIEGRRRLRELETERTGLEFALRAQRGARGMELHIVDMPLPAPPLAKELRLLLVGSGALLLGFPICALLIGAFTRKIHTAADLAHLGVPCLGRVSAEPYARGRGRPAPRQRARPASQNV